MDNKIEEGLKGQQENNSIQATQDSQIKTLPDENNTILTTQISPREGKNEKDERDEKDEKQQQETSQVMPQKYKKLLCTRNRLIISFIVLLLISVVIIFPVLDSYNAFDDDNSDNNDDKLQEEQEIIPFDPNQLGIF